MDSRKRKHPRLKNFDYSRNGNYFVTICTKNRNPILSTVGRDAHIPPSPCSTGTYIHLTDIGKIVDKYIHNINVVYNDISMKKYIIMPNHIHLLINIQNKTSDYSTTSLHTVVRSLKTLVTKEIGYSIWQSSYYDSILWTENSYYSILNYIESNPENWENDDLYCNS